ncbi:MAG: hypothetical protein NTU48_01920 [Legionellales bacterium]|nr:hypothetical protein [Legionellales bacterium]
MLNNEATTLAVNDELEKLCIQWQAGHPDFETFQKNCDGFFTANLPAWQRPPMQVCLERFLKALCLTAIVMISMGLLAMLNAEIAALFGLITIAAFHFKTLAILAGVIGSISGVINTVGLFTPKNAAKLYTQIFITSAPTAEEPTTTNAM